MKKPPVLTKNGEFKRVYSRGKYAATDFLVIYCLNNKTETTRIGITASKKVGNSVRRNRMRRLIKENIRILYGQLAKGFDIVIVARKNNNTANLGIIGTELRYLLHRVGLLDRECEC
ncbi:MAG: ribonuclease P protein component [Acetivibrionales bacterium]|jgi:ribonuclease P protein component